MLSPKEIAKKWETTANQKGNLSAGKCFFLAVLAGLYIALGAAGCTVVQASVGGGLGKLLGACVFPAGLMLVVMAGGELFTGNCLMAGPAVRGKVRWLRVLRNWLIVYAGNFCGALLAAVMAVYGGVLTGDAARQAMTVGAAKASLPFVQALLKGVGCNILVCGAVWMASGAEGAAGKAVCCFFPVMLFVVCGLEHSVANMYYLPAWLMLSVEGNLGLGPVAAVLKNLLPVTMGNLIGGAGLAAVYAGVYHD